ncbi:2-hydroxychromene-2-carboxylate isomerase [Sneathiella limimaris]|uniref:2-hydroxychromene-2-carboxylate isomerase n=1 Tax=Sneathiella limimaris TaxID=1964213 RepID=UPI00146BBE7A|nr:2-hydroxychromene-2-carboxylate isomerase [Sneathiella limimaris]
MKVEYFFASYSAFAYIGNEELHRIASRHNLEIRYVPFDLRATLPAAGATPMPERSQAHKDYFFGREISRTAEYRGLEILDFIPTHHANDITLSNCLLIAADQSGADMRKLTNVMMHAHWAKDADLDDEQTLLDICAEADLDGMALMETARTADVLAQYEKNTKEAIERSVFGSPTYFLDGDMFYGQDRLEMMERAIEKPYKGRWPIRG